jgi:hypothetical protein
MRELMFDMETAPISLPFVVVLFVSFIAVDIERLTSYRNQSWMALMEDLICDFAVWQGCYLTNTPAI